jgi:hypothetical protein
MRAVVIGLCCWLMSACSWAEGHNGDACHHSAECAPGLACVSNKCSNDLSSIAAHNTVPQLGAGSGGQSAVADASTPDGG